MRLRPRTIVLVTFVAALLVFAVVQDRVTASAARQYVGLQREAIAGRAAPVPLDDIMAPAVERSVRLGLTWGGVVMVAGSALAWFSVPGSGFGRE